RLPTKHLHRPPHPRHARHRPAARPAPHGRRCLSPSSRTPHPPERVGFRCTFTRDIVVRHAPHPSVAQLVPLHGQHLRHVAARRPQRLPHPPPPRSRRRRLQVPAAARLLRRVV